MLFDLSSDAAGYLHEAAQCEQAARKCRNPVNRDAYLRLAHQWRTLAKDAGGGEARPAASNDRSRADRESRSAAK